MTFKKIIIAASLLILSACSKATFFAINLPAYFNDNKVVRNIDFGSEYGSEMDIYIPKKLANDKKTLPVIVFFYGGKWSFGSKSDYAFVADAFTKLGYIVAIPDYVQYPKYKFPAWQFESAKAVTWVYNNISKYSGDNKNMFLAGYSAGAHIGALLATDNKYMQAAGGDRSYITAFAGLAGPYDFIPDEDDLKDMFGPPEKYKFMHVSNYIDGKQAPILLLWGQKDTVVGEININNLKPAFNKNGGVFEIKYYPEVDHIDIIGAISIFGKNKAPVIDDLDKFFRKNFKN
jgi:acetyl esterase/lipase